MNSQILFAGVDVSSETLDIHYNLENGKELTLHDYFANADPGISVMI
jgi:hypothetical protein